ncbi:hypothetical protein SCT_3045 [Sulfuricella sp. T08]|nr:hypothetical protein SCT_3045 [Sulfuricella sp. T08]
MGLRQSSPKSPGPAALLGGGPRGPKSKTKPPHPALPGGEGNQNTGYAHKTDLNPPLHRLGFSGESGAVGCVCLRPKAEFNAAARFARKIEGSPKGRCGWVPFCLVTYILGKQNKVTCCRAAPGI